MGNFVEVARVGDIESGTGRLVEAGGREIALFNCSGVYYAIDNTCTHVGGPLCDGDVAGETVTCPWHGSEFDLKTGEALAPPAEEGVRAYRVLVEGGGIKIEL